MHAYGVRADMHMDGCRALAEPRANPPMRPGCRDGRGRTGGGECIQSTPWRAPRTRAVTEAADREARCRRRGGRRDGLWDPAHDVGGGAASEHGPPSPPAAVDARRRRAGVHMDGPQMQVRLASRPTSPQHSRPQQGACPSTCPVCRRRDRRWRGRRSPSPDRALHVQGDPGERALSRRRVRRSVLGDESFDRGLPAVEAIR